MAAIPASGPGKYYENVRLDTFETASPAGTLEIRGQQLIPTDRVAATDEAVMADGIPFSLVAAPLGGLSHVAEENERCPPECAAPKMTNAVLIGRCT